jgi:hypothetical protein
VLLTVIAMVAAGFLGFELQSFEAARAPATVQVLTGEWAVDGDTGLPAYAGCGECPASTGPLGSFTVHVTLGVGGAPEGGCRLCGGFNVSDVGVEPPFVLLHSQPSTFPTLVPQNSSKSWNFTIEVPDVPGTYYLNGFLAGSSY